LNRNKQIHTNYIGNLNKNNECAIRGGSIMTHNERDDSDNNNQSTSSVRGGELRNGRLSQIKNNNPKEKDIPNEYISEKEDD
jgi:hypothetical protein